MYDYLCVSTMPWSVFGMLPLLNHRTVVFFNSSHSGDTFIVKVTSFLQYKEVFLHCCCTWPNYTIHMPWNIEIQSLQDNQAAIGAGNTAY